MSDLDKQYINYNLSLVDPQNIEVITPIKVKLLKEDASGDVVDKEDFDIVDASLGTNFKKDNDVGIKIETPEESKQVVDLRSYALNEEKTDDISILSEGFSVADFGLAREFPLEPIDPEFKTHILPKPVDTENIRGTYGLAELVKSTSQMEEFEVTDENQGKDDSIEIQRGNLGDRVITKILDQEYEKTKPKGSPSKYIDFRFTNINSGKDDTFAEADLVDIQPKELNDVKVLKKDALKTSDALDATISTSFDIVKVSNGQNLKADNVVNFMDLSPFLTSKIAKTPYTKEELTYDDVIKKLNIKGQVSNLGSVHVYPSNPGGEGGILSKYEIPFEFNPNISEGGRSAKFEATSLLSRIGDIQSYIKTDAMSIQLTTRYQVLSVNQEDNSKIPISSTENSLKGDHQGVGTWMESFHLRNVQSIEMAYRGLVYPQLAKGGGSFFRPPVVKVVFGNTKKVSDGKVVTDVVPFNSLLTYPYRFSGSTKMYHKSFIVTKVDIKKDWENTPVILNEENDGILDLQGFDVTLNLIEVDPMYIGVLPSFEDYYSIVKETK